ncbi:conditioned medium-induced protein 4 [Salarchaeum japonicum]|nr:conditioned medium-induced protein 4 [Salarchaeum japonicum]
MNEKTEELRDIFLDVTEEDTVTETQTETHGTLASDDEVDDRLRDTVAHMQDALDFTTDLTTEEYVRVVRGFYADEADAAIARDLDTTPDTVARARLDLHLLTDTDLDAPFEFDALDAALDDHDTLADAADALDVSPSTVRRYRRVRDARRDIRRVNDRYRDEFEAILTDRELTDPLTESVQEDGLDEATEGQEMDVSL